jgi:adenylyl-sulfate kinase
MTTSTNVQPSGVCIFLTGFSGAGKSTIAAALDAALHARHVRTTLLDGDVVRMHLSRELGFSREDRDRNIARIGFVAAEVVKHGGVCIVAAIAPYDAARKAARAAIEAHGRFVLVHVATSLATCEARDVKALYKKARSGEIKMFTGVSDAYETPSDAEIVIDGGAEPVESAVARILAVIDSPR